MIDQSAYLDQPYILNVQAAAAGLRPGELRLVDVLHDDDCPKLRGGHCRCAPIVRPMTRQERRADRKGRGA